jgi:hypothetical protein
VSRAAVCFAPWPELACFFYAMLNYTFARPAAAPSRFLDDLDEAVFIYQTLENVLADTDGKQLLTEVRVHKAAAQLRRPA